MSTETLMAIVGLGFGFVVQLLIVAYLYGRLTERVRSQGEWIQRVDSQAKDEFTKLHQAVEHVRLELSASLANLNKLVYDLRKEED